MYDRAIFLEKGRAAKIKFVLHNDPPGSEQHFHAVQCIKYMQVSFGVHDEEERAARMYDRAIILEKGRAAKTNFPLHDYDQEIADFELFAIGRYA